MTLWMLITLIAVFHNGNQPARDSLSGLFFGKRRTPPSGKGDFNRGGFKGWGCGLLLLLLIAILLGYLIKYS